MMSDGWRVASSPYTRSASTPPPAMNVVFPARTTAVRTATSEASDSILRAFEAERLRMVTDVAAQKSESRREIDDIRLQLERTRLELQSTLSERDTAVSRLSDVLRRCDESAVDNREHAAEIVELHARVRNLTEQVASEQRRAQRTLDTVLAELEASKATIRQMSADMDRKDAYHTVKQHRDLQDEIIHLRRIVDEVTTARQRAATELAELQATVAREQAAHREERQRILHDFSLLEMDAKNAKDAAASATARADRSQSAAETANAALRDSEERVKRLQQDQRDLLHELQLATDKSEALSEELKKRASTVVADAGLRTQVEAERAAFATRISALQAELRDARREPPRPTVVERAEGEDLAVALRAAWRSMALLQRSGAVPPEPLPLREVTLALLRCEGLAEMGNGNGVQPFCVVRDITGKDVLRSTTAANASGAFATEDATTMFLLPSTRTPVTVEVWAYRETGQHGFLGCAAVTSKTLLQAENGAALALPLRPRERETDSFVLQNAEKLGRVVIGVRHTAPSATKPVTVGGKAPTSRAEGSAPAGPSGSESAASQRVRPTTMMLVHVSRCSDLLGRDTIGGQSDPFVIVQDMDGREIKRTPTVDGSNNPTWPLDKASLRTRLPATGEAFLSFEVWDCDVTTNDFLGYAVLRASDAVGGGTRTLQLLPRPKENDATILQERHRLGSITVELTPLPETTAPPDDRTGVPTAEAVSAALQGPPQSVLITVVGCNGLFGRDLVGGANDPFVTVWNSAKQQVLRTPTADGTNQPSWSSDEATCRMVLSPSDAGVVTFEVWDSDVLTNDFLGQATVPVAELLASKGGRRKLPLGPRQKENDTVIIKNASTLGTITIEIAKDVSSGTNGATGGPARAPTGAVVKLQVCVVSCADVLSRDTFNASDPMVDVVSPAGDIVFTTPSVDNTNNPKWEPSVATCFLNVTDSETRPIVFDVWDKDVVTKEFLGRAKITVGEVLRALRPHVLPLQPKGDGTDNEDIMKFSKQLGSITVTFVDATPSTGGAATVGNTNSAGTTNTAAEYTIHMASCEGLLARDAFGGAPDPYVELRAADGSLVKKTATCKSTSTPSWTVADASAFVTVDPRSDGALTFMVWDADFGSADDFLGQATLPIRQIEAAATAGGVQLPLAPRPNEADGDVVKFKDQLGHIVVKIAKRLVASPAPASAGGTTPAPGAAVPAAAEAPKVRAARLDVTVVKCEGLMKRDVIGASDPFVTIRESDGKVLLQTPTASSTQNPTFPAERSSTAVVVRSDSQGTLVFDVWDEDVTSNDFLGQATIALAELERNRTRTYTLPLKPRPGEKDTKISGASDLGRLTIAVTDPMGGTPAASTTASGGVGTSGGVGASGAQGISSSSGRPATVESATTPPPSASSTVVQNTSTNAPTDVRLVIDVLRATNLTDADGWGRGASDPVVSVFGPTHRLAFETPTMEDTLNPVWEGARGTCTVRRGEGQRLLFKVEDVDAFSRDPLGEATVEVDEVLKKLGEWSLPLVNGTGSLVVAFSV